MNPSKRFVKIFLFISLVMFSLCSNLKKEKELTKEDNEEIEKYANKFLFESLSPLSAILGGKAVNSEKSCGYCKIAVAGIRQYVIEKHGFTGLNKFLTSLCTIALDEDVCANAIDGYAPIFFKSITNNLLDETQLCAKIKLCPEGAKYVNQTEYAEQLLKSKPEKKRESIDTKANLSFTFFAVSGK